MLTTTCLFHYFNLSQYLKKLFKSAFMRKSNPKYCTVTSTKDTHKIPKKYSVVKYLVKVFFMLKVVLFTTKVSII